MGSQLMNNVALLPLCDLLLTLWLADPTGVMLGY